MRRKSIIPLLFCALAFAVPVSAQQSNAPAMGQDLTISLKASKANPASPKMGDNLSFVSDIVNTGTSTINGDVVWVSLVQVNKGFEQPVDLEDWSAHKAVVLSGLKPGESRRTDWPMRLIKDGDYRVVISSASGTADGLITSPMVSFHVARKPVVESARVLPVSLGIPFLILLFIGFRLRKHSKA